MCARYLQVSAQEPQRCSSSAPAQRGAARQQLQLSAGTTSRVGDLCGSVRALSSPGLHAGLLELLTSFSGFQQVIHVQDQPTWLETSSAICSHGPSLSAAIGRVAQGEVVACPLFLISCGQFTLYSHSFEDFALPYRDLSHKPHTPPAQMPYMPPSQASQLPWQCLGHVHALKQTVHVLLWSQHFPLQESLILSYNSILMPHLPPFPE